MHIESSVVCKAREEPAPCPTAAQDGRPRRSCVARTERLDITKSQRSTVPGHGASENMHAARSCGGCENMQAAAGSQGPKPETQIFPRSRSLNSALVVVSPPFLTNATIRPKYASYAILYFRVSQPHLLKLRRETVEPPSHVSSAPRLAPRP